MVEGAAAVVAEGPAEAQVPVEGLAEAQEREREEVRGVPAEPGQVVDLAQAEVWAQTVAGPQAQQPPEVVEAVTEAAVMVEAIAALPVRSVLQATV